MAFDDAACGHLQSYVYALFDPRRPDVVPFYIGKGVRNRVFDHARGGIDEAADEKAGALLSPKLDIIAKIRKTHEVDHRIIRYGLTAVEALRVEASLIDLVNLMHPKALTNAVKGHRSDQGIIATNDLFLELNAPPLRVDAPFLLVKIERRWRELLAVHMLAERVPREAIYKAVRGDWNVSEANAKKAVAVLAVARGIVRGVFLNEPWAVVPGKPGESVRRRMQGKGEADPGVYSHALHCAVKDVFPASQNPVKHVVPTVARA